MPCLSPPPLVGSALDPVSRVRNPLQRPANPPDSPNSQATGSENAKNGRNSPSRGPSPAATSSASERVPPTLGRVGSGNMIPTRSDRRRKRTARVYDYPTVYNGAVTRSTPSCPDG